MIELMTSIFIATLILSLLSTRLFRIIFWYSLNSISLGMISYLYGVDIADNGMILTAFMTIILKGIIIPIVLKRVSHRFGLERKVTPKIKLPYTILFIPAIIVFVYYLATPIGEHININEQQVSTGIAALFLSLYLIVQHKTLGPKIMGFLFVENALFFLGTTATEGMPMFIEIGIFFDLLLAVVIVQLLLQREEAQR